MRKIKLSSLLVFGLSILLVFFFQYCKHAPGLGAANPFGEDPYDAVGSFAVLLAPLGALLMLVRVFRPFPGGWPDDGQLLSILRSGAVSLLAVGVTLVADAAGLGRALLTSGFFPAAVPLAALVGGMALLLVFVTGIFAREISGRGLRAGKGPWKRAVAINALGLLTLVFYPPAWREGSVQGAIFTAALGMLILFGMVWASATVLLPGEEPFREDIFDDLAALLRGWKNGLGRFAVPLVAFEKLASAPWDEEAGRVVPPTPASLAPCPRLCCSDRPYLAPSRIAL